MVYRRVAFTLGLLCLANGVAKTKMSCRRTPNMVEQQRTSIQGIKQKDRISAFFIPQQSEGSSFSGQTL